MNAARGGSNAALAAAAAFLLTLAGCEATVTPPPANPGFCPKIYQPVCARTPGGQRTFPNACTAEAEGFRAYSPGECRPVASDRICPQIYMPVCAERAGQLMTYPNDCVAGAQGARLVRQGPC
jgi:hypothetical protein